MNKFLHWLTKRRPARLINGPEGEPYLVRYFLFCIPVLNITAYLHHFVASDPDRDLHDHPWGWSWSYILSGGYNEIIMADINHFSNEIKIALATRWAGQCNFIAGDKFHRIILPAGQEAWTIFIHGPRKKGWGFLRYEYDDEIGRDFYESYTPYVLNRGWLEQDWWKRASKDTEIMR